MSDLISRSALIKRFKQLQGLDTLANMFISDVIQEIKNQPPVESVPVVHGEWKHLGGDEWCCSECGHVISTEGSWEKPEKKFCENCGADTRKKVKEYE